MATQPDPTTAITRREVECVLRDGVALRTTLLVPAGAGPWPALMTRHPYDVSGDESGTRVEVDRLVAAGYLVALQDVRGRYGSGGEFDPSAQELDDGADAVAWLADLPECDGRVGMWGASYASETQFSALLGGAPALRSIAPAVTPVATGLDGFRFRGGVPEIGSMTAWSHGAIDPDRIAHLADETERARAQRDWEAADAAIVSGAAFAAGALDGEPGGPTLDWMRARLRDPLDAPAHAVGKILGREHEIDVPMLLLGGWYDVFLGSTLRVWRDLPSTAPRHLVVGPWSHDDWTGRLGDLDFGPTASSGDLGGRDLTRTLIDWFDATLAGRRADPALPPARVFVMGLDRWVDLDGFPATGSTERELFLGGDGALTDAVGPAAEATVDVDPADPVPTRGGATLLFPPYGPGPVDQGPLESRADVLSWRSEPLDAAVAVLGPVEAVIHLASTGTDADVVVRLSDEHPDGRVIPIADGVQRGSARATDPLTGAGPVAAIEPGAVLEYRVDLWSTAHVFRPGHRIRVDLTPSSSPRWDVNPGVYPPAAPRRTRNTVHLGSAHPSRLRLTVPPPELLGREPGADPAS
ncbi:MAG: CocE/NonD family hydrolase [Actinomycetales bacterium]|nr:CocE/NonD family hydrolase [Actinomycetales bacterium]